METVSRVRNRLSSNSVGGCREAIVDFDGTGTIQIQNEDLSANDSSKKSEKFDDDSSTLSSKMSLTNILWNPLVSRTKFFATLIVLLGMIAAGIFLGFGLSASKQVQDGNFERIARETVEEIEKGWRDYEVASLWIHQACHRETTTNGSSRTKYDEARQHFHDMYEYLVSVGLDFQFAGCSTNTTNEERNSIEKESRTYYADHYPDIRYRGIVEFEQDSDKSNLSSSNNSSRSSGRNNSSAVRQRSEQPFYFPVHYVEPVLGNEEAIDFDLNSIASEKNAIDVALQTWKPVLTQGVTLIDETDPKVKSVLLLHPGVRLASNPYVQPHDVAILAIRVTSLLSYALKNRLENVSVYIYDVTDIDTNTRDSTRAATSPIQQHPIFLGAAGRTNDGTKSYNKTHTDFDGDGGNDGIEQAGGGERARRVDFLSEVDLDTLRHRASHIFESELQMASVKWNVVVVASEYDMPDITFVVLASTMMIIACICLALWLHNNMNRASKINQVKIESDRQKAALLLQTSRKAAKMERDLNDFIAHEVRNPLAAALSACTFVSAAVNETPQPLPDEESQRCVREDVSIIDSSLHFINDLLRNMLDMHRVSSHQMLIEYAPTDILKDVLQPVDSMIYRRDETYELIIDCPDNLIVNTDRLRLKQIMLNLSRNASKFVERGFIRMHAFVDEFDGNVVLSVEDSGSGIPSERRGKLLFSKFQESLDTLRQGTGIGLCLCKKIAELMDATISLDETYDSGIEGCPGTRFVINLNVKPVELEESDYGYNSREFDQYPIASSTNDAPTYEQTNTCISTEMNPRIVSHRNELDLSATPLPRTPPPKLCSKSTNECKDVTTVNDNNDENGRLEDATQKQQRQEQQQQQERQQQEEQHAEVQMGKFLDEATEHHRNTKTQQKQAEQETKPGTQVQELPQEMSILFVDDDLVLRKLFARSVRKLAPGWNIQEAASGESALRLIDSGLNFDIIFVDQYMASVEKQLLGTETTRALRAKGVQSKICGLSANNVEEAFLNAGADFFLFKPLPCEKNSLAKELNRLIHGQRDIEYKRRCFSRSTSVSTLSSSVRSLQ